VLQGVQAATLQRTLGWKGMDQNDKTDCNESHTLERLKRTFRVLFYGLDMIYTGELRI